MRQGREVSSVGRGPTPTAPRRLTVPSLHGSLSNPGSSPVFRGGVARKGDVLASEGRRRADDRGGKRRRRKSTRKCLKYLYDGGMCLLSDDGQSERISSGSELSEAGDLSWLPRRFREKTRRLPFRTEPCSKNRTSPATYPSNFSFGLLHESLAPFLASCAVSQSPNII